MDVLEILGYKDVAHYSLLEMSYLHSLLTPVMDPASRSIFLEINVIKTFRPTTLFGYYVVNF